MGFSGGEIFLVLLAILVFFGADKIPELIRSFGKGMNEFKKAADDIKRELVDTANDLKQEVTDLSKDMTSEVEEVKKQLSEDLNDSDKTKPANELTGDVEKPIAPQPVNRNKNRQL